MTERAEYLMPTKCPACGADNDRASATHKPVKGDISLCITCGTMSEYDGDKGMAVLPHSKLWELLSESQEARQLVMAWHHINKNRSSG